MHPVLSGGRSPDEDRHAGQAYELTGPRLLTFAEAVEEIAKATGPSGAVGGLTTLEHRLLPAVVTPLIKLFTTLLGDGVGTRGDGRPPPPARV